MRHCVAFYFYSLIVISDGSQLFKSDGDITVKGILRIFIYSTLAMTIFCNTTAYACDLCAIYTSIDAQKPKEGSVRLGISEQFTEYGKVQKDGEKVNNEMHQRLVSSITQLNISYDVSNAFGLHFTLPYINRRFSRIIDGDSFEKGTEAGIGDIIILSRYNALQHEDSDFIATLQLVAGVKLPTGDTDLLKEESHTDEIMDHEEEMPIIDEDLDDHMHDVHEGHDHESIASAIHNHDLSLGSGSVDFPLGFNFLVEKGRIFTKGAVMYTIRTEGDHDYRYADDLMWDFGPGYLVHLDHDSSVAARVVLSGEHKANDKGKREIHGDTSLTSLFVGPEMIVRVSDTLSADLGIDFPVNIDNSGTQAVANYRLRAGVVYRF